ncbi:MAG: CopD family protein [Candidatus Rokuibacteriota bacterium]
MRLLALWVHVLGAVVWLGGLVYQVHVLAPRAGQAGTLAEAARRARPFAWTALGLTVLTGFYNVTRFGPLERVLDSGAALLLAGKFLLVLALVALAGHRDFAQVPRLARALAAGEDPSPALTAIGWLDRIAILLGVVIVYLGLAISRS